MTKQNDTYELFVEGHNGGSTRVIGHDEAWKCTVYSNKLPPAVTFAAHDGAVRVELKIRGDGSTWVEFTKTKWRLRDKGNLVGINEQIYRGPIGEGSGR